MPRTLESIVECHQAATELCKAGKPVWRKSLNIKRFLNRSPDDLSEENAARVANEIGAYLRNKLAAELTAEDCDFDLEEIVEQLEQLRAGDFEDDPTWSVREDLNARLDELYDWADRERVWLG